MAERKFRFVSPGVFINEIDNSQLPNTLPDVGPIIIGRAERGPAMRPVRVSSPSEFIDYLFNNEESNEKKYFTFNYMQLFKKDFIDKIINLTET